MEHGVGLWFLLDFYSFTNREEAFVYSKGWVLGRSNLVNKQFIQLSALEIRSL